MLYEMTNAMVVGDASVVRFGPVESLFGSSPRSGASDLLGPLDSKVDIHRSERRSRSQRSGRRNPGFQSKPRACRHWRVKAAIQAVLGSVPRGAELHHVLQRRFGGPGDFDAELRAKIDDGLLMIAHLRSVRMPIDSSRFLETGSGWYRCPRRKPRLPELAGATGRAADAILGALRAMVEALKRGADVVHATGGAIEYRAPSDARATGLTAGSMDVVFSNDVLEHVPEREIEGLFVEAERVLRPGGVVFHSVNCGDHYAYIDGSISQLNYLRYSEREWAKYSNTYLYQNRLRAVDFTRMARAAGFEIEVDTSRAHPKRLAELAKVRVHPQFSRCTAEQLAITSVSFIGRKRGGETLL